MNLFLILTAIALGVIGGLYVLIPIQIRTLMAKWIGFWQRQQPTEEWYTLKWTPNYIRALGAVYLLFAVLLAAFVAFAS